MNCFTAEKAIDNEEYNRLKNFYFHSSPTQIWYNIKTTLIKLSPAIYSNDINEIEALHVRFLHAGGLTCLLDILTQTKYTDSCDTITRKSIYLFIFYILKRFLIILGFYQLKTLAPSVYTQSLEQILGTMTMITNSTEQTHLIAQLERKIALLLHQHATNYPIPKESFLQYHHIIDLMRVIWCLASNNKQISFDINIKNDFNIIHQAFKQEIVSFVF